MLQWLWTEHTFIITTWKWPHYLQRLATDPSIHINWSISLIFKIIFIALLKYNLLNMQSVHWKCTIHRFLTASRVRQSSLQLISKGSSSLQIWNPGRSSSQSDFFFLFLLLILCWFMGKLVGFGMRQRVDLISTFFVPKCLLGTDFIETKASSLSPSLF